VIVSQAYFEEGQTIGQLYERLAGIFSPDTRRDDCVTEVTRAAAEGERGTAKEIEKRRDTHGGSLAD